MSSIEGVELKIKQVEAEITEVKDEIKVVKAQADGAALRLALEQRLASLQQSWNLLLEEKARLQPAGWFPLDAVAIVHACNLAECWSFLVNCRCSDSHHPSSVSVPL
jgi:hypothetical protein